MKKYQIIHSEYNTERIRKETDRVEIFSDAVFAIIITLLILDIQIPSGFGDAPVSTFLSMWPNFFGYFLSFMTIGIYWVEHHNIFNFISKTNRKMMWLNLLFLMFLALIPFPTHLLSMYFGSISASLIYGVILLLVTIFLYIFWNYVTQNYRLTYKEVSPETIKLIKYKLTMDGILYCLGIIFAFVAPHISLFIYLLVILSFIMPHPVGKTLHNIELSIQYIFKFLKI